MACGRAEASLAILLLVALGFSTLFMRDPPVGPVWMVALLIWIALRVGAVAVIVSVASLAVGVASLAAMGQGPFAGPNLGQSLLRIGVLAVVVPSALIVATWLARRAEARALAPAAQLLPVVPPLPKLDPVLLGSAAVVATHLAAFSWWYLDLASFNFDMDRDLTRTVSLVTGDSYPFVGPKILGTSISLGSLTYLIFAIPVSISDDPLVVHLSVVVLGAGAIGLITLALRTVVRPAVAALGAAALLATGPWFTGMLLAWHATLAPMAALCFWAGAALLLAGGGARAAILMCAGAAAAPQLHASMAPLPVLCLLVLAVCRHRLRATGLAAAVCTGVIVSVPLLLGFLVDSESSIETALINSPPVREAGAVQLLSEAAWGVTPTWDTAAPSQLLSGGLPLAALALVMAALLASGGVRALWRERGLGLGRLALLGLALGVPFALLLPTTMSARYAFVISIPGLLLVHYGLDAWLPRKGTIGRWLPLALLATILGFGVRGTTRPHHGTGDECGLLAQRQVARLLIDEGGIPYPDRHRMHGAVCRRPETGFPYFLAQRPRDLDRVADIRTRNLHVALLPLAVPLHGRHVVTQRRVTVEGRSLRMVMFRVDPGTRLVQQPTSGRDPQARFQMPIPAGRTALNIDVRLDVLDPFSGVVPRCAVVVLDGSGRPLPLSPVTGLNDASRLGLRLPLSGAGDPLTVEVSRCPSFAEIDVY